MLALETVSVLDLLGPPLPQHLFFWLLIFPLMTQILEWNPIHPFPSWPFFSFFFFLSPFSLFCDTTHFYPFTPSLFCLLIRQDPVASL